MDAVGINFPLLTAQVCNLILFLCWVGLAIMALLRLSRQPLSSGAKLGWSALILLVPILGALAFLIGQRRSA